MSSNDLSVIENDMTDGFWSIRHFIRHIDPSQPIPHRFGGLLG